MNGWSEPRCVWCHGTGDLKPLLVPRFLETAEKQIALAHSAHEADTRRYFGRVQLGTRAFLESAFLGLITTVIFLLYLRLPGLCAVVACYGVIFLLFPFPTNLTLELIGVRKGVRLARVVGSLFAAAGAVLLNT